MCIAIIFVSTLLTISLSFIRSSNRTKKSRFYNDLHDRRHIPDQLPSIKTFRRTFLLLYLVSVFFPRDMLPTQGLFFNQVPSKQQQATSNRPQKNLPYHPIAGPSFILAPTMQESFFLSTPTELAHCHHHHHVIHQYHGLKTSYNCPVVMPETKRFAANRILCLHKHDHSPILCLHKHDRSLIDPLLTHA
jgi:hypothetical protein